MESSRLEDTAEDAANDFVDRIRPTLDDVKDRLKSVNDRVKGFVREHPAACVAGAGLLRMTFQRQHLVWINRGSGGVLVAAGGALIFSLVIEHWWV